MYPYKAILSPLSPPHMILEKNTGASFSTDASKAWGRAKYGLT